MVYYVSLIGMVIVTIILALGIKNLLTGGSPNRSQKFMRLRVIAQFIAIVCVMCALYFTTK